MALTGVEALLAFKEAATRFADIRRAISTMLYGTIGDFGGKEEDRSHMLNFEA